ncbi:unnamed protein product [Phytophthora lilii]|uniref:Unnamed protein product n=1 Tax=Phytophthora lilii TaxID=2077276 RepID=A0A9W6WS53_9STRA|nr:unnamed protein product [Phytophthora lilii]
MATDWRAEYAKAAALEDADDVAAASAAANKLGDRVLAFVDLMLAQEGGEWWQKLSFKRQKAAQSEGEKGGEMEQGDKTKLKMLKKRLAEVAAELLVELPELNKAVNGKETPREAKVRVLQLQLVCRMLRYGVLIKKKKEERKKMKKEIRGLLDRVALLLDAANPPSLADEDADERSPFQEFLQQGLARKLQLLLPELVKYLLKAYELEEEDDVAAEQDANDTMTMMPTPPPSPAEVPVAAAKGKSSILSALREERPAKRSRPDASELFKEVQLPHQLQQQRVPSRPHKSRRISRSHSSSSSSSTRKTSASKSDRAKLSQEKLVRAASEGKAMYKPRALEYAGVTALRGKAPTAPSGRQPSETDLLRRAAKPPSAKTPTHLLHRTMSERSHFSGRQQGVPGSQMQGAGSASAGRTQSPSGPGSALRRAVTTSSVVMRTPDRPKRLAAGTTRRVLVEASPPLRRPSSAGAAPRLLQPKSSRPGSNPPPLFR